MSDFLSLPVIVHSDLNNVNIIFEAITNFILIHLHNIAYLLKKGKLVNSFKISHLKRGIWDYSKRFIMAPADTST